MEILRDRGVEFDVVEYLKPRSTAPTSSGSSTPIPDEPAELVRKDKRFTELGLNADDYTTREAVIDLLLEHPELMQRPVVFKGDEALICRPSDKVLEFLD